MTTARARPPPLAAERDCGGCTACCTFLPIEAPGFYKPAGKRCMNCVDGIGCGVYATRPQPCRDFLCGWRVLDIVPESLRPDRSGVIAVPDEEEIPPGYANMSGVKFIVTGDGAALRRLETLECIAGLVHARAPVFLAVAKPDGVSFARAFLNRNLQAAAESRNALEMERIVWETFSELRRLVAAPNEQRAVGKV